MNSFFLKEIFNPMTFQGLIFMLQFYWLKQGCIVLNSIDLEVGAGTSHPMTFLRAIGPEPISAIYIQPSRRPTDGRYGENKNRLQNYYQFQVIMKPVPENFQKLYINSLKYLKLDFNSNDIKFVDDNWENPTLGAWGSGWEVWLNGIEITQFTYFQQIGGLDCNPITGEITYGLERLAMYFQKIDNVYDIVWGKNKFNKITYGELFFNNEVENSKYNFDFSDNDFLFLCFDKYISEVKRLLLLKPLLLIPAYEYILKASHVFNLLDAKNIISNTERQRYILKIRNLTKKIAYEYYLERKRLNFPICKK